MAGLGERDSSLLRVLMIPAAEVLYGMSRMISRKRISISLLAFLVATGPAVAGGYSAAAVPTKIEIVRSEGFMLTGEFGNPGGCTYGNLMFVKSDHPQYKQMYATALAAHMGKQKISAYVHSCEVVAWFSAGQTMNAVHSYSSLAISD